MERGIREGDDCEQIMPLFGPTVFRSDDVAGRDERVCGGEQEGDSSNRNPAVSTGHGDRDWHDSAAQAFADATAQLNAADSNLQRIGSDISKIASIIQVASTIASIADSVLSLAQ
jgi:hypothetical protein